MISEAIGKGGKAILDRIVWLVTLLHINPNVLTFVGLMINIMAAITLAYGLFFAAGLIIIAAGLFDMLDGQVARVMRSETAFGAFFDSVIDRYSDIVLFIGLVTYYARTGRISYVVLTCIVLMGAVMTSYTRARAECIIPKCKVGFLERPERIVLLIIGSLANRIEAVLWVMAVLGNWTVIDRIYYTWKETTQNSREQRSATRSQKPE